MAPLSPQQHQRRGVPNIITSAAVAVTDSPTFRRVQVSEVGLLISMEACIFYIIIPLVSTYRYQLKKMCSAVQIQIPIYVGSQRLGPFHRAARRRPRLCAFIMQAEHPTLGACMGGRRMGRSARRRPPIRMKRARWRGGGGSRQSVRHACMWQ